MAETRIKLFPNLTTPIRVVAAEVSVVEQLLEPVQKKGKLFGEPNNVGQEKLTQEREQAQALARQREDDYRSLFIKGRSGSVLEGEEKERLAALKLILESKAAAIEAVVMMQEIK